MLIKFARFFLALNIAVALASFQACSGNNVVSAEQNMLAQQPVPTKQIPPGKSVLYVSNFNANTITVYDAQTGALLGTVLQAGPELKGINGFDIASDGSFYVAGQDSNNIVHYSKNGELIEVLDRENAAGVSSPQGVTFGPDGLLYVASMNNGKVVRYDITSKGFRDVFAAVNLPTAAEPQPIEPRFDSDGNLTVSTFKGARILKYQGPRAVTSGSPTAGSTARTATAKPGTLLLTFQVPPKPSGPTTAAIQAATANTAYASGATFASTVALASTSSAAVSAAARSKNRVFVDAVNPVTLVGEVQQFLEDGTFVSRFIPNGRGGLVLPGGISMGPDRKLYVANVRVDSNFKDIGSEILRFDPTNGKFLGVFVERGKGLDVPFVMRFEKSR
jgi:outer membrane protein assembly factor BamB